MIIIALFTTIPLKSIVPKSELSEIVESAEYKNVMTPISPSGIDVNIINVIA